MDLLFSVETYIKVVLASPVAGEGLNLKNIREIHILDPWYHFNKAEQVKGRAIRYLSHIALPIEKRNTTVYMYTSIFKGNKTESVDLRTVSYTHLTLPTKRIV